MVRLSFSQLNIHYVGFPLSSAYRQYTAHKTDSMESLIYYVEKTMAQFEDTNPGPLFPLSEYGNTCFVSLLRPLSFFPSSSSLPSFRARHSTDHPAGLLDARLRRDAY